jgi:hypothetical protein
MILGGLVAALALVPAARRFRREDGGTLILGARVRGGRVGAGHGGNAELSVDVR